MISLTLPERIIAEKITFITCVRAEDDAGLSQYFYISVRGDRMEAFKTVLEQGNFDPEDYGNVLAQGYGEPPESLQARMEKDYDCKRMGISIFEEAS